MKQNLNSILAPYQRFGINLGLERINNLLANLNNPHLLVPMIHVAGTNGKGSVCAYLSSILTEAGYQVGRYTSPHLVNWNERICLNEQPISTEKLAEILLQINQVVESKSNQEIPTQFEVITAAAWLFFAQSQVDIAIMEVGLGGRLDATNVVDKPLITVITSISREHWQRLGPTVAHIAQEKAGILKKNCPAVIGKLPSEAKLVVENKIKQLNCPAIWVKPASFLKNENNQENWAVYEGIEYPLNLCGEIQLFNSALAIASIKILQEKGWKITIKNVQTGMKKARWKGRIEWVEWQNQKILIDGAHNPEAAQILRQYIDTFNQPVSWIMGMLSTKDHQDIFQALLRDQDELYLVPVPDHSTASPEELAILAQKICPHLAHLSTHNELFIALNQAIVNNENNKKLLVICGSLYLLGYFLSRNLD
jgi:dihydrofolate synthase/folylpolyglutamate synthase